MPNFCCFNEGRGTTMVSELAAAGFAISGSVGAGGANKSADVKIVQQLLNMAGALTGGVRLAVDGMAGPLTNGAIRTCQKNSKLTVDGRIDPHGPTLARLNALFGGNSNATPIGNAQRFGVTGPAAPPAPPMSPVQAAKEATPRAILWTNAAIAHLKLVDTAVRVAAGDMRLVLPFVTATVNTHFHLDRDPSSILVNIDKISRVFSKILQVLNEPDRFYTEGAATAKSPFADAPMGGHALNLKMTFRTCYPTCGPNVRSAMLVHEGAHFCGGLNEINHFAMEFPAPQGQPQDGSTRNYEQLTTSEAMRNASSYAAFAIHAAFLTDHRFGAADLTK